MDIAKYIAEIEKITRETERPALLAMITEIEARFFRDLHDTEASCYRRGAGSKVSNLICRFKDAVVAKSVDWCGGIPDGICLLAVGGYGRGELCPFSDLDILILHRENARVEEFAHGFLYVLWDLNYHLGSSTRTIRNLMEHSRKDVTFLTAVFESRYLAGDRKLAQEIEAALKKVLSATRNEFLRERLEDANRMARDAGMAVLMKEPNVKDNAGALRSIHMMEWLNFAFHLRPGLRGMESLLPRNKFRRLEWVNDFLLYIRNHLHFSAGRKEDHLLIEFQPAVAEAFGFKGPVEQKMARLMRHFYELSMEVLLILLGVIEDFQIRYRKGITDRAKWEKKNPAESWMVSDGWFYVKGGAVPSAEGALRLVLECARGRYKPSYSLIHYLSDCRTECGEKERTSKENFSLFRSILELENSYDALSVLKLSGFLYRFVPVFGKIRHRILYNPFHQYTVDQHSIEGVKALERLFTTDFSVVERQRYLPFQTVADQYRSSLWVLKLALLLHDTGKIFDGDHSKNGVELADRYMSTLPVYHTYRQAVLFLIRDHLTLSNLVRRTDISSMQVLQELKSELFLTPFPGEYMDFLYLMTYSDVSATNPRHFTSYLSNLLTQVYRNVSGLLLRQIDGDYMKLLVETAAEKLSAGRNSADAADFVRTMGERYVLSSGEEEIAADFDTLAGLKGEGFRIFVRTFNDHFRVRLFVSDRIGLFATIAGVFALNGADVVRANIHTWKGAAIDDFTITSLYGGEFSEHGMKEELKMWTGDLEKALARYLADPESLPAQIGQLKKRIKPVPQAFHREISVEAAPLEENRVRITVSGTDRPALLFDVARFLAGLGFSIRDAIIDTTGWYVRDSFLLEWNHPEEMPSMDGLKTGLAGIFSRS